MVRSIGLKFENRGPMLTPVMQGCLPRQGILLWLTGWFHCSLLKNWRVSIHCPFACLVVCSQPRRSLEVYFGGGAAAVGLCCCTRAFSSCSKLGYSSLQCLGLSLQRLLLLGSKGSSLRASAVAVLRLSCSAVCVVLVPGPGTETVSPALAGGFLTSRPAEKSGCTHLILQCSPNNLWKAAFCAYGGTDVTAAAITSEQPCSLPCFSFPHRNSFFSLSVPHLVFLGVPHSPFKKWWRLSIACQPGERGVASAWGLPVTLPAWEAGTVCLVPESKN